MAGNDLQEALAQRGDVTAEEAYRAFLARPRVRAWVAGDPVREARLREEFLREWSTTAPASQAMPRPTARGRTGERERYLCPRCRSLAIHAEGAGHRCRVCLSEYPDARELVPVEPVGVVGLLFGPGRAGYVKAGLLLLVPLAVHLALWALRHA